MLIIIFYNIVILKNYYYNIHLGVKIQNRKIHYIFSNIGLEGLLKLNS